VSEAIAVREAASHDFPGITRIYGHHVVHGLATFEDEPPSEDDMLRRYIEVQMHRLPWLVAEGGGGAVVGYAYAMPYRLRAAYRFTLEDSIYVAPDAMRRGVGCRLLSDLVERCTALGHRQMIAVIGDSANAASIRLHEKLGFRHVGMLPASGFKHNRWVDSVLMQRALGDGDTSVP